MFTDKYRHISKYKNWLTRHTGRTPKNTSTSLVGFQLWCEKSFHSLFFDQWNRVSKISENGEKCLLQFHSAKEVLTINVVSVD